VCLIIFTLRPLYSLAKCPSYSFRSIPELICMWWTSHCTCWELNLGRSASSQLLYWRNMVLRALLANVNLCAPKLGLALE